jgi:RNA polymerase sigma factor (sigma-70 family)
VEDEVTLWLGRLAGGDDLAAERLWEQYYQHLVRLAQKKLGSANRGAADEDDVVLSAFNSFCGGAKAGRFPRLGDRENLWKLLVTIVARKARAERRRQHTEKRGGGRVRGESAFGKIGDSGPIHWIDQVLGDEPTPQLAAEVAEECKRLLEKLDDTLRSIALAKLEGYANEEIADRMDCSLRTVKRRLAGIRKLWKDERSA